MSPPPPTDLWLQKVSARKKEGGFMFFLCVAILGDGVGGKSLLDLGAHGKTLARHLSNVELALRYVGSVKTVQALHGTYFAF